MLNSRKIFILARSSNYRSQFVKNLGTGCPTIKELHTSSCHQNYVAADILPIPNNIDAAETTRFSPHRARDISSTVIVSHYAQSAAHAPMSTIDITADNTITAMATSNAVSSQDPHVQSYDCFGAVSLNSVMQSNVPTPGLQKFSHLNMPGGQWSQEYKFMSQNLHSSHYRALRESTRSAWATYDQNATLQNKGQQRLNGSFAGKRDYCTQAPKDNTQATKAKAATPAAEPTHPQPLSKKEQLKKAFKDYGSTVVGFHVAISLLSLGGFYLLVSGGINMMPALDFLGLASSSLAEKLATGSTFVVAYAIHKVFAPVRISITLGATPFIVRYLRSKGFLKPKILK